MKKFLIFIMFLIGMNVQAQEVFNELRQKNKAITENPQSSGLVRSISQFKLDALNYLVIKMQEETATSPASPATCRSMSWSSARRRKSLTTPSI